MIENRLQALRALMDENKLDAVIVSKYVNLHYFSGFRGDDTMLVIGREKAMLITDSRYTEQAAQQAPLFELVQQKDGLLQKTAECVKAIGAKRVGFEGNALIYDDFSTLTKLLAGLQFDTALKLDTLRQIKDAEELAHIRKACRIADLAFEDMYDL